MRRFTFSYARLLTGDRTNRNKTFALLKPSPFQKEIQRERLINLGRCFWFPPPFSVLECQIAQNVFLSASERNGTGAGFLSYNRAFPHICFLSRRKCRGKEGEGEVCRKPRMRHECKWPRKRSRRRKRKGADFVLLPYHREKKLAFIIEDRNLFSLSGTAAGDAPLFPRI